MISKRVHLYAQYMSNAVNTFEEDRPSSLSLVIYCGDYCSKRELADHLEDDKLTWVDDRWVNTHIIKQLKAIKAGEDDNFRFKIV
jgi:N utilization substance protein B